MKRPPSLPLPARLLPLLLLVCAGAASANNLPSFVTRPNTVISCDATPFGRYVTLGQDAELITEVATSGSFNAFDEYRPDLTRSFRSTLLQTGLVGAQFQKGTSVDLNGDGKDEVVTANRMGNGDLKLAVYRRDAGPAPLLFDSWTVSQAFTSVDLVAGDFDGSTDGKQEIAVLLRTAGTPANLRLFLLSGASDGGIAQTDNTFAGYWTKANSNDPVTLARGDLLLDGRDQLVVIHETGSNATRTLNYHLLEYQPTTLVLPIGAGNTLIGSQSFASVIGTEFATDATGNKVIGQIIRIEARTGDLVDSAAAELVLHLHASNSNGNFIGQRLHHFTVTRSNGLITAVNLATDFSQLAQSEGDNGVFSFETAIANVDAVSPAEIVVARATPSNLAQTVEVYKVYRVVHQPATNPPTYDYRINSAASYQASLDTGEPGNSLAFMNVAVADMDADGVAEVMTLVRDAQVVRRSRWKLTNLADPLSFSGIHVEEPIGANSYTAMDLQASDFDGDSVHANVSTTNASCQQVREPMLRSVVWWPPYFQKLQGSSGQQLATFGSSISGGASSQTSFGTFTSHDVSVYLGASVGGSFLGIGAEAAVRATAGYNYQSSRGELHGTENTFDTSEHFAQSTGEGLVVMEENTYDCYSYTVARNTTGVAQDSGVRMCEVLEEQKAVSGTDVLNWDTAIPAAAPAYPPAQWMPLQRDWSSLALFRPVSSASNFTVGNGADKATDGLFDTGTESASGNEPYLQVDLGAIHEIADVRIFPVTGQARTLQDFRLYASSSPMNGAAVPTGAAVRSYAPETSAGFAYNQWNIWTNTPGNPLRARYVRLQRPGGSGSLRVAEIQVFGNVHVEAPRYPQAICDPVKDDHFFNARVWDPATVSFRTIQVRGDIVWNGTPDDVSCGSNFAAMKKSEIWSTIAIGNSAVPGWDLSSTSTNLIGDMTSIESSVRAGASLDVSGGFVAQVQAGGAYEYSSGVTEDVQTTTYWGSGLQMGGNASPFNDPQLVASCDYRPQPYAYRLSERSNTGFEHTIYVVDYVVREGGPFWTRAAVPPACLTRANLIFSGGFE